MARNRGWTKKPRRSMLQALIEEHGKYTKAGKALGVSEGTLRKWAEREGYTLVPVHHGILEEVRELVLDDFDRRSEEED